MRKLLWGLLFLPVVLTGCASTQEAVTHDAAVSSDSERIAYSVRGEGETALVFIHGWSCDSRYWTQQLDAFAKSYRVIAVDLAGHGDSSADRKDYTMRGFAEDVKAVLEKEKIDRAILIGHSMGGGVMVEAACLMPETVVGVVGVDTLHDVSENVPQKVLDGMAGGFDADFKGAMRAFVGPMLPEGTDEELVRWIQEDMSSATPKVAMSAFRNYMGEYVNGQALEVIKRIDVPVVSINARLWPTKAEANRTHIQTYRLFYIEETGHFPMLEKPAEFNRILVDALKYIEDQKE